MAAAAAASFSITDDDLTKDRTLKIVSPSNPVPHETIFLSNIDLAVAFTVETIYFFEVDSEARSSASEISRIVKKALTVILVPYYFMAGRLDVNQETGRLELVCNNGGVLFVNAKSRVLLREIGDLSLPNPSFRRFVHRPGLHKSFAERALFTIQVTEFACGGFAIGMVTNHGILDGKSASQMFQNLASVCRGEGLKNQMICNNRTCFKARNPPQIRYPHKEYIKLKQVSSLESAFTAINKPSPSPSLENSTGKFVHELIPFTPQMISTLKEKAKMNCSSFEVILAQLWRARTRAVFTNQDELSTVLFAVDIRSKISPALPTGFAGNAVITAFATAKVSDLVEKPFSFCVDMVKEGIERVTNEYVRSAIDWLEVYKGIPATCNGSFYVSAWWKLPFNELDFGFGKPAYGGPIANGNDEFVLLISHGKSKENGKSINVWISLEKERMKNFMVHIFKI